MRKILTLGALALASVSSFAQNQQCSKVVETLFAQRLICFNQTIHHGDSSAEDLARRHLALGICLAKASEICEQSLLSPNAIQRANTFEMNAQEKGISCQQHQEDLSETSENLAALDECNQKIYTTYKNLIN
jgi:hypothetical protein